MRLRAAVAIARRDLRLQFAGRQRIVLPLISALLLGPMSLGPSSEALTDRARIVVSGEVPDRVRALPEVEPRARGGVHFRRAQDGTLEVISQRIPTEVRDALDQTEPFAVRYAPPWIPRYPSRGLLIALLASSTLGGSLAQSLPGERSDRTLTALRAAAVTPLEIVAGKVLAWGGWGAVTAMIAASLAIGAGRIAPGWWMLAMITVPFAAAAFGLFVVRNASDVVGGSTVALRGLPLALSGVGVAAYFLHEYSPIAAALLPGGGALLASGGMFDHTGLVLLSVVSTVTAALVLTSIVAGNLDPPPPRTNAPSVRGALVESSFVAVAWWACLGAPSLWRAAGADALATSMTVSSSLLGASVVLYATLGIGVLRTSAFTHDTAGVAPGARVGAVLAALFGAFLITPSVAPLVSSAAWLDVATRLATGVTGSDVPLPIALAMIGVQEALFRGRLPRLGGDAIALGAWTIVATPLDPLLGLGTGLLWLGTARLGGAWWIPAIARAIALLLPVPALGPWGPLVAGAVGLLAWQMHARRVLGAGGSALDPA